MQEAIREFRIADTFTDSLARLMRRAEGRQDNGVRLAATKIRLIPHELHKRDKEKDKKFMVSARGYSGECLSAVSHRVMAVSITNVQGLVQLALPNQRRAGHGPSIELPIHLPRPTSIIGRPGKALTRVDRSSKLCGRLSASSERQIDLFLRRIAHCTE